MKRILRSRDLFTGVGERVDLGSYVNKGEEGTKKRSGGAVHTVMQHVPAHMLLGEDEEEEYTGPRPLEPPPGWTPPLHPLCKIAGRLVDL